MKLARFSQALLSPKRQTVTFSTVDTYRFFIIQFIRAALCLLLANVCFTLWDIGLNVQIAASSLAVGTLTAGLFLRRKFLLSQVLSIHVLLFLLFNFCLNTLNYFYSGNPTDPSSDFFCYQIADFVFTALMLYSVGFLATWTYWTHSSYATFEAILLPTFVVWLLAGHRHYNLEVPKVLSEIGWQENWAVDKIIGAIAFGTAAFIAVYLFASHNRPLFEKRPTKRVRGQSWLLLSIGVSLVVFAILSIVSVYILRDYESNIGQASEGVGMTAGEGETPLSFQSAVGKTRQPAALVRLENNFANNPWSPMLYLREGALSEFKKIEFVKSGPNFDTDVPRTPVGQPYVGPKIGPGPFRKELTQSIYLLAHHSSPFGVDIPTSIRTIRNPDPVRFNYAYQVNSLAPVVPLREMRELPVGDPSWSKDTLEHYLRAPGSRTLEDKIPNVKVNTTPIPDDNGEDLRYRILAKQLTGGIEDPIQRAFRIVSYLSEHTTYTRSPGHKVAAGEDPVAPYLFATDMRGYCVHFAHAGVFLMRLSGIPARIATGYVTDLKYAKDGHFLLQLGDRHAWPEIYVYGHGWVVVDISPARAENESTLVPDEKLLEELMSKIDPAEHLKDPQTIDTSALGNKDTDLRRLVNRIQYGLLLSLTMLASLFLIAKIWLRFSYLLASDQETFAIRSARSFFVLLTDLGLERFWGETRKEYSKRLKATFDVDTCGLEEQLEMLRFSNSKETTHLAKARNEFDVAYKTLKLRYRAWKIYVSFISPRSLIRFRRW